MRSIRAASKLGSAVTSKLRTNNDADTLFQLRKNEAFTRRVYDLSDPLLVEGPALGVHTDFTIDSGPRTIDFHLSEEAKSIYLSGQDYRFRIIKSVFVTLDGV
jgi:hypothetical protein